MVYFDSPSTEMTPNECNILTSPQHSKMMAMACKLFSRCCSFSMSVTFHPRLSVLSIPSSPSVTKCNALDVQRDAYCRTCDFVECFCTSPMTPHVPLTCRLWSYPSKSHSVSPLPSLFQSGCPSLFGKKTVTRGSKASYLSLNNKEFELSTKGRPFFFAYYN